MSSGAAGHQTLVERAWQMIHVVVRWLPGREVVFVADSSYAGAGVAPQVSTLPRASRITRLRLDAALYDPPPHVNRGTRSAPTEREAASDPGGGVGR